ncbi:L-arabinose isomerase [Aureococcus anophagefferens]|nr:L-arabinose isomerase [Aureococcus anophagefferens]
MVFLTMHSSQENARFRLKPGMKLGLLVLERRQERCLDFAWAQEMRARCHAFVKALCRDEGHAMIALNGPDERVADDRTLRASLERARASCDVVVATQPTSADGALAAVLAQHCALPVVFWATPENFEVVGSPFGGISSKSLVGAQDFAAALSELLGRAAGADEATIVEDRTMEHPFANLASEPDADNRSNRLYVALKSIIETENLDALAVRCGPEIARDYGTWPYVALTRLADEGSRGATGVTPR